MPRRSEHSLEEIRELALQAVNDLVHSDGVQGVSARKVAARIGYTVGMLYHVFDNIDDLILQANAKLVQQLVAQAELAVGEQAPANALRAMATNYLELAQSQTASWQLVFGHSMREGRAVPDWYQQLIQRLFELLEQALSRLAPNQNSSKTSMAARALWSAVHGVCLLSTDDKLNIQGDVDESLALEMLMDNFINGWCAPHS